MGAEKKKQAGVLGLIVALVVVLIGSLLFVGAVSGWFDDPKISLDAEYYCEESTCSGDYIDLSAEEYESLAGDQKSFIVFVDQAGCHTADRLRDYMQEYSRAAGIKYYRIMFADAKDSSLHDKVKYYPSVAIISKGHPIAWLKADSDEDSEKYNNYDEFKKWLEDFLK